MKDTFGNGLTVTSQAALQHYEQAVDAQLHAWPGVLKSLDAALAHAPDFALAHALTALVLATFGQTVQARAALGQAQTCSQKALPREQSYVELVTHIVEGRAGDALAKVIEHATFYPADALAASPALGAYGLFAFSGQADHNALRHSFTEAMAPHYPDDFAWLMAYRGWARIELGQVDEGLAMAQRAIALRPANGHNAHIVLHGLSESANPVAVLDFMEAWLPGYPDHALMWGHLQWHAALAEIEFGRLDAAVARLLGPITEYLPRGLPFMGLVDTVALMWRLGLRGANALPWSAAQSHAERHFPGGSNVFGELHLSMLGAARRDRNAVGASLRRLEIINERGHGGAPVAMRFAQGLMAMLDADADAVREHLTASGMNAVRLGGSHVQRQIVEQTLQACRLPPIN